MKAFLILEDGHVFTGTAIGADKEIISEIVFNTSMTGYLEVLTDPSYAGQAVVMTYPLIGNYGICYEDMESKRPWPDGYIVRELSRMPSNFRSQGTIYPADTKAEDILAANPDGIMLSNGPGDPKECTEIIKEIKKLYDSNVPIFAICLGHQLMALANGLDTHKMKYGHRGGNHPVKDLKTGRVYITSQNHGYVVDTDKLDPKVAVPAFVNVNDGTNEGLSYTGKNIFTVQYHPEACPGPQDSAYLFDRFLDMMAAGKNK